MHRQQISQGALARRGFADPTAAGRTIAERPDDWIPLLDVIAQAGDPDLALLGVDRLTERCDSLMTRLHADPQLARRLILVLGGSNRMQQHVINHPEHVDRLAEPAARRSAEQWRTEMLTAVDAAPEDPSPIATGDADSAADSLRVAYLGGLLPVMARDLGATDPIGVMPDIAAELSDLAAAVLEAALAIARRRVRPHTGCRLAVVALGKCGAAELNYASDVDVLFVAEAGIPSVGADDRRRPNQDHGSAPCHGSAQDHRVAQDRRVAQDHAGGQDHDGQAADPGQLTTDQALTVAGRLAADLMRTCSAHTAAGTIFQLDAGLRPEGSAGPLVRTLASHRGYYRQWASGWEFQAMLKARAVAGDRDLGRQFVEMISPMVWQVAERDEFLTETQQMRQRVIEHIPAGTADRELKLGAGGLRDVEFAVQLLQLVHGRADHRLRARSTLDGLGALIDYGYVGRDDGAEFGQAYRFLRTLEHRIQLYRLQRTHVLPAGDDDLRRLGRLMGYENSVTELVTRWRGTVHRVRRLHQRLFYSPLLDAVASIPSDALRLTQQAAQDRLKALGYQDPAAALQHIKAVSTGVTRQAEIQRQLLPAMLGWFAEGPNPDHGLLAFRQTSQALGRSPWYLRALRDEGAMAERLAHLLASSRYAVNLLQRAPETVQMLADEDQLWPRPAVELRTEMVSAADRQPGPDRAVEAIRAIRRRELFRIAASDLLLQLDVVDVGAALTDLASATVDVALRSVRGGMAAELPDAGNMPDLAVIAMGRWGGRELGYGSDVDAMFVSAGNTGPDAAKIGTEVITELSRLLKLPGADPGLIIDTGLRPEGRDGPMLRTVSAYEAYYRRWSSGWEIQALIRADALAGDAALGRQLLRVIDTVRWPAQLSTAQLSEIRRLKARMESERIPRGIDPAKHLKLGPGGLNDVEWAVQLLQLQHAHRCEALRTPRTVEALRAARAGELIDPDDADTLESAWRLASRIRNQIMLVRGRASDAFPSDPRELSAVAELMGRRPGQGSHLLAEYQGIARRARGAVDRLFRPA